jgi:membrane protein
MASVDSPSAAPTRQVEAQGWHEVALGIYTNISEHRVLAIAAGITFYSLLALFPALAALVSLYGLFSDPATITRHLESVSGLLPGGAIEVMREQMTRVAAQHTGALGLTFVIGLGVSLWSANAAMKALFDALTIVYGARETRGFIKLNAISLLFTAGAIVFVLLAIAALVVIPVALKFLGLAGLTETLVRTLRWPTLFVAVALALAIIYRFGACHPRPQWRWITWGSATASLAWLGGSALFSWYAENFGSYNETYGSLGAAIGFMIWMWLSATVVLIGAEIDAELERRTDPAKRAENPRDTGS